MQLLFHAGPLDEFLLLMPLMRALPLPMTVVAPWQRTSLSARMIGTTPMDIELFEFSRLHVEGGPTRVSPAVGDLFDHATQIISFLSSEQDNWATNVQRLSPNAKLIRIDPRPPADFPGHFIEWHIEQLASQGVHLKPIEPKPLSHTAGPIVVHPGSSAIKRCWPAEQYEALIDTLTKQGHNVKPVIGEVELERWSPDRMHHWTETLGAEVFRSADTLVPVLQQARLFICNDAGPMHLAAQLGTPTLGILGPTEPNKWAPRAKHFRYVAPSDGPGRIEDVTLAAVLASVGLE
ncbi:MAG: glycosyltransferase family 9 protein [Phycisphaeraceae bacterium]